MRRFFILPLLLLPLISCNESGLGIFYSISREQPLEDTTLPNTLSVSGMVKGTQTYYVSAGGLYSRDISAGQSADWDDEVLRPSEEYTLCLALVEFKGDFYGLFSNIAGDSTQIYKSPRDSIEWDATGAFDDPIVALAASESYLFVTERPDSATYVTTASPDGSSNWTALALSTQHAGVTDAVDFSSAIWLMSGSNLYYGSGASYSQVSASGAPPSSVRLGGLFVSDALSPERLFVSNAEGYVYSTDGLTWDSASVTDAEGNPIVLYDFEEVSISDAQVVVVGAENGYYDIIFEDGVYSPGFSLQVPGSEEAGSYSSSDANFLNINLRRSAIRMFFLDEGNATLFAGTSGNGLWVNPISARKWDRQ